MQKSSLRRAGFLPYLVSHALVNSNMHPSSRSCEKSLQFEPGKCHRIHPFFPSAGLHHGTSRHIWKKNTSLENSRPQAFCLRGFSDKLQTSTLNFAESWSLHRRLRREAEVKSVKLPARCGSLHTPRGKNNRTTKKIHDSIQKPVNISQCCTTLRCISTYAVICLISCAKKEIL